MSLDSMETISSSILWLTQDYQKRKPIQTLLLLMSFVDLDGSVFDKKSLLQSSVEQLVQQKNMQVLTEKKVLLLYVSGVIGAEEEMHESHVKIKKGGVFDRMKGISYLCDLEYT